jgi:hypothetical protein
MTMKTKPERKGMFSVNRTGRKTKTGSSHYQIVVLGELGSNWADWLGEVLFDSCYQSNNSGMTTIIGAVPDQAALRGLLNKLWDLNLTLVSINFVEDKF